MIPMGQMLLSLQKIEELANDPAQDHNSGRLLWYAWPSNICRYLTSYMSHIVNVIEQCSIIEYCGGTPRGSAKRVHCGMSTAWTNRQQENKVPPLPPSSRQKLLAARTMDFCDCIRFLPYHGL
jgi:hypothetical protein